MGRRQHPRGPRHAIKGGEPAATTFTRTPDSTPLRDTHRARVCRCLTLRRHGRWRSSMLQWACTALRDSPPPNLCPAAVSERYFLSLSPRSSIASPTLRLVFPSPSWTSPPASSATPSSFNRSVVRQVADALFHAPFKLIRLAAELVLVHRSLLAYLTHDRCRIAGSQVKLPRSTTGLSSRRLQTASCDDVV
jgi:hypothetical protein